MSGALKKYQIPILVAILVIGGFIAYSYFFTSKPQAALTATAPQNASGVDDDLISLLAQLKTIRLDGSFFSDPVYQSLQDFSQQLVPEPVGRPDPFAPLSGPAPLSGKQGPAITSGTTSTH